MPTDSLTEALRGLDPARRALLDLSLRHGVRPDDLAEVLGMDSAEVISLREAALAAVAGEAGMGGGGDVDRARAALAELPLDQWVASAPAEEWVPEGAGGEFEAPAGPASGDDRGSVEPDPAALAGPDPAGDRRSDEIAVADTAGESGEPRPGALVHATGEANVGEQADPRARQAVANGACADSAQRGGAFATASATKEPAWVPRASDGHEEGLAVVETATADGGTSAGAAGGAASAARRRRFVLALALACALVALAVVLAQSGGGHPTVRGPRPVVAHTPAPPRPVAPQPASAVHSAPLAPLAAAGPGRGTAQVGPGGALHVEIGGVPSPGSGFYELWLYNSVVDSSPVARFSGSAASVTVRLPPGYRRYHYLDVSLQQSAQNPNPSGISVLRVPLAALKAGT